MSTVTTHECCQLTWTLSVMNWRRSLVYHSEGPPLCTTLRAWHSMLRGSACGSQDLWKLVVRLLAKSRPRIVPFWLTVITGPDFYVTLYRRNVVEKTYCCIPRQLIVCLQCLRLSVGDWRLSSVYFHIILVQCSLHTLRLTKVRIIVMMKLIIFVLQGFTYFHTWQVM